MSWEWIKNTAIVYETKEPVTLQILCTTGTKDQQANLCFYSSTRLRTTTQSKITNTFHFWFKRKSCLRIKWTQTDNAPSFVTQVLLMISGRIRCVTQRGVESLNWWPLFLLLSQHAWQFSRFHWLVCRSEPWSQLAIHSRRCAHCARWLDCMRNQWNWMPSAQKIFTDMGIK